MAGGLLTTVLGPLALCALRLVEPHPQERLAGQRHRGPTVVSLNPWHVHHFVPGQRATVAQADRATAPRRYNLVISSR